MSNAAGDLPGRVVRTNPFEHVRTAALYELLHREADGRAVCTHVANVLRARTVVDIGCGTGQLTVDVAGEGRQVVGLDPANAMLEVARVRPQPSGITWVQGTSHEVAEHVHGADLAVMTGHVAQFHLNDDSWRTALRSIRQALRPGGALIFDTRNPDDQAWLSWNRDETHFSVAHPTLGTIDTWVEVTDVDDDVVTLNDVAYYRATGESLVSSVQLRFPSTTSVLESLEQEGFAVRDVYGDWDRTPFTVTSTQFVVVCTRADDAR